MQQRLKTSRWLLLLAAAAAALLTARLGFWQLDRAAQKNALQAAQQAQRALPPLAQADLPRTSSADVLHRAALLQGRWSPVHTVYLDNRQMDGRPGFFVLTPLVLDGAAAIVVQRGWLPRDNDHRTRIAPLDTPAGEVRVSGRIAPAPGRLLEFDGAASGAIRQNLDLGDFARETGLPLLPYTLQQAGDGVDGLQRRWPQPAAGVEKHYGYAFQWFALSALVIGLYVWFQLVRPALARRRSRA